jgi:hypothetical protein
VAERARYVGSAEHKSYPFAGTSPHLRSDASRCDPRLGTDPAAFERFTAVLRAAIRRECTSGVFEAGFPKYVWGRIDGILFEARHINGPVGTYKAYPLESAEYPLDADERLNWEH